MIDPLKKLELDLAFDLEFEQDLARRGIKPLKHIELEKKGWREWLMTLFPFWFSEEFSKEHIQYWELHWNVLQKIKNGEEVPNKELIRLVLLGRGLGKSSLIEAGRIMRGAVLGKGYSLIISETDDQAQEHLGNCRILIEHPDSKLTEYYPDMAVTDNADTLKGMPTADRKEMFICKNGYILRAKGLSAKMRGLRVGIHRPDDLALDDIDDVNDSLAVSANKLRLITASILPVQARENVTIDVGQNLINEHSVVNQIYTGKADALAERTVIGVANAFEVLDIDSAIDATGKLRHKILDTSIPSWEGFNVVRAQKFLDNSGLQTFLAEYQNQFDQYRSGRVIPEYDEISQVITWSQFEKVFGQRRIPKHWRAMVGLDVGYSEGEHPHYSSWAFIATASMNSALPGALFLYRNRTFINTSIDLQAEDVKAAMWDGETVQMWRMSHEKTGEMLTLQQRHQLPFDKFKNFKSSDGIAQWRHLSMRDKTKPNPFKEDEQGTDGLWKIGRPSMYYIVDDEQLITPRDDNGLKLLRDQVSTWELVPVKLTDMGLSQEKPSKVNDDTCLIAGTKILTLSGERNIEDIAVGDMALTRKGYRKVLASGKTGRGAIYTMRSTCGKTVSGTGNHPIILANGDVKKLRYIDVNDTILVCENNQGKARELILRGLRFIATLTPSSIPTETIIRRIGSEVIHPSTSLSGKIGRFAERLVEKSTIFVNGLLQKIAHSAERLLRRYAPTRWCAVSVANVDIDTHEQDVYNLTVDDAHEYFANGILVHNCDSIKSVLADWAATAVPLTEVEKWELKMRDKGLNKDEILKVESEEEKIAKLQVRLIEERAFAKKKQTGNKSGVKLGWR